MNEIGSIIAEYRKKSGLSQNELAEQLNKYGYSITNKAVSKWEKNVTFPSIPLFLTACKILGVRDIYETCFGMNDFNPITRLNDEGQEKALDYIQLLIDSGKYQKKNPNIIPLIRKIPLFSLPASAGTGEFLHSDDYELIDIGDEVPFEADFAIHINGDSMEPRFVTGQIVWVHKQETLRNGDIGIFVLDDNAYCKKFQDNENGVFLISLNTKYEPIPVTENSSFKICGRVIA